MITINIKEAQHPLNSRRSVNKRQPVGRKDSAKLTQTDKMETNGICPQLGHYTIVILTFVSEIMGAIDVLYVKYRKIIK